MVGKRITDSVFSDRPAHGRSFRAAMFVIGGLASLQFLALVYGILNRTPVPLPASSEVVSIAPAPPQERISSLPVSEPVRSATIGAETSDPPPLERSTPPIPLLATDLSPSAPSTGPAFLGPADSAGTAAPVSGTEAIDPTNLYAALASTARSQPLTDGILERLLVTGSELRVSGNTQGALQAYREVESALPDHPRVLCEIAATLGRMGLGEKSKSYWERVESLGAIVAGPYFPIAGQQIRGEAPTPPPAPEASMTPMKIGEIKVEEAAPTSEGQKVSLNVVIDADPSLTPVGEDLKLIVNFYDRVADGDVRPSTADTSYLYPTEPYDWKIDGTETIIVNYNQPVFTEEQKRELGERSFYGYAIKLYYRDELQDKVAMPEDIAALRFETAPDGEENSPGPAGPENALFPGTVIP